MVDATTFGALVGQRREKLGLSFRGAGQLVGMTGNTWKAHEQGRVVDGRVVERQRETPYTDALMALAVGITPAELDRIKRPDAAKALRDILDAQKSVTVTEFHKRWLREQYEKAGSDGEFLDRMLAMVRGGRTGKRPNRRPT